MELAGNKFAQPLVFSSAWHLLAYRVGYIQGEISVGGLDPSRNVL